jgi:putative oxidoreductase
MLLAIGLLTPLAAAIVLAIMLVAVVSAHAKGGFCITSGGYEYNVVLGAAAISLTVIGPGPWSLDAFAGLALAGPVWGAAAVLVGIAGSVVPLQSRRAIAISQ